MKAKTDLTALKKQLIDKGYDPVGSSPEEFARYVKGEAARGGEVVRAVRRSRAETGLRRLALDLFHAGFGRLTGGRDWISIIEKCIKSQFAPIRAFPQGLGLNPHAALNQGLG